MNASNGWKTEQLGDVCDVLSGFGFPKRLQGKRAGDLAFFKVGDISEAWKRGDVLLSKANHYLDVDEAAGIRAKPLPENTTVFAKIGAAIALNRRAILSEPALVDNNVMGLHPASNALDHKYLYHFFCTVKLDELSRATTVPSVRKGDIQQIEIPIPETLEEQQRIVAEIEKQFTRLDAGMAGLKRVQANLKPSAVPEGYGWPSLIERDGDELETHYRHVLENLGKQKGMLGLIFKKAQNKIQDPAKLRRLIVELIDKEQWTSIGSDVKGDAYEGLLEKNASDVKGGAGQYFTPRALIASMVDAVAPQPGQTICDPACGTGGFLLAAHDYLVKHHELDREQKKALRNETLFGIELVDSVTRLCAMNLLLHGIGGDADAKELPVTTKDGLSGKHGEYDMVLANPPFGKKSSVTIVNDAGEQQKEALIIPSFAVRG